MTTYKTGNPIGSTAVKDLYDNAENLDTLVNDKTKEAHPDRLGVERKTWHGMEAEFNSDQLYRENEFIASQEDRQNRFDNFIASSGYQFLGDYAAGIEITEYNQLVRDANGEFWRVSGQVELPYTTTGTGLPENDAFVTVGDAALRQELAIPGGAALVGQGVMAVNTIADLLALPTGQRKADMRYLVKEYHAGTGVGGGEFYWDGSRSLHNDGFSIIAGWARVINEIVTPEQGGAKGDGINDDGPSLRAVINYLNDAGGGILDCRAGAVYSCSVADNGTSRPGVIRPKNGIDIRLNGATIQTNDSVLVFNYNIIDWTEAVNCTVSGGRLKGNKHTPGAATGGFGMGIGLHAASNCKGYNLIISEHGGDGIYVGRVPDGKAYSENIEFTNVICDDNRRQGVSIISAKNLKFTNLICKNTSGLSPEAGIDIEPNNTDEWFENIEFNNVQSFNNAGGALVIHFLNYTDSANQVSLKFNNFHGEGGVDTLRFRINKNRGYVSFSGTTYLSNGIRSNLFYETSSEIKVSFENIISKCDTSNDFNTHVYVGAASGDEALLTENLNIENIDYYGVNRPLIFNSRVYPVKNIAVTIGKNNKIADPDSPGIVFNPGSYENLKLNADPSIYRTSHSGVFTALSSFDFPINHYVEGPGNTSVSELRVGSTVSIFNMKSRGESTNVEFSGAASGRYFAPGGIEEGHVKLKDRGAWVKIKRISEQEFRILDGIGYELSDI